MSWFFSGLQRFTAQPVQGCNTLDGICGLERELDRHLTKCPIEVCFYLCVTARFYALLRIFDHFLNSFEVIELKHTLFGYTCGVSLLNTEGDSKMKPNTFCNRVAIAVLFILILERACRKVSKFHCYHSARGTIARVMRVVSI